MKTKYLVIGAGVLVAMYVIYSRKEAFFEDGNEDFRSGYTAGFFTPGPFTILAIAGALTVV